MSNYPSGVSSRDFDDDSDYRRCRNCGVILLEHKPECQDRDLENTGHEWNGEESSRPQYEAAPWGMWDD